MKEYEAIDYLEKLKVGNCITVNIPIIGEENYPITAMYMGKDRDGRYKFADSGRFMLSKDFINKGKVSIDKNFDKNKAIEIHKRIRKESRKQMYSWFRNYKRIT